MTAAETGATIVFFRILPDNNSNADECDEFLRQLKQNIKGKIILW